MRVKDLEKTIQLSSVEKDGLFWDFLLGRQVPQYLREDIKIKSMIHSYLQDLVGRLEETKGEYRKIVLSTPEILNRYQRVRVGAKNAMRVVYCRDDLLLKETVLGVPEVTIITTAPETEENPYYLSKPSRIFPSILDPYALTCGMTGDGNVYEEDPPVSQERIHANPPEECSYDEDGKTEVLLMEVTRRMYFGEYPPWCQGALEYTLIGTEDGVERHLYYLTSKHALVNPSPNATVFFQGTGTITLGKTSSRANKYNVNRIHFASESGVSRCTISTSGTNLIYPLNYDGFNCRFRRSRNQRNIVVLGQRGSNFEDVPYVEGIVGSSNRENITVRHSRHVDGGGGGDWINLTRANTVVSSNFGDTIVGQNGTVILPFPLSNLTAIAKDHDKISFHSNPEDIPLLPKRQSGSINVQGSKIAVATLDGYFVAATKFSDDGRATQMHATLHLDDTLTQEQLSNEITSLRSLPAPLGMTLVRQILTPMSHTVLADSGPAMFLADKGHSAFFWEGDALSRHVYFPKCNSSATISRPNGIIVLDHAIQDVKRSLGNHTDFLALSVVANKAILLEYPRCNMNVTLLSEGNADTTWKPKLQLTPSVVYDLSLRENSTTLGVPTILLANYVEDTFVGFDGIHLTRDFCSTSNPVLVDRPIMINAQDFDRY